VRNRSPQALWETALGQLELQVTRPNFETWLRHTVGLRLENEQLVVGVPSDFALEWLRTRMSSLVTRTVSRLIDSELSVAFEVLGVQPAATAQSRTSGHAVSTPSRPADLDPRLTFESFLALKSNRVAYRAAKSAASDKCAYNPLVLVGSSGVGKTHLLHAIGNAAVAAKRSVSIMTGEGFVDRYGRAVRTGQPHTFRQEFDSCDMFLLDDFGFLPTRAASLEQFFHLFNTLAQRGCLVVVTTDQHPNDSSDLPARIRSRVQGGLVAELNAPAADERLDLVRAKAAALKADLPDDVLQLIADMPYETVRELEGGLHQVLAFSQIAGKDMTPPLARKALFPLRSPAQPPTPQQVIETVCSYFRITREQMAGPSRARDITYPRHVAIYLLRQFGSHPLTDIGQLLGGRDHSTVISAFKRIQREVTSIPDTRSDVQHLERLLAKGAVA
jgi:chromosomal replication initiator protein